MIKLFIDDVRMPSDVGLKNSEYIIVRDFYAARKAIAQYKPSFISFDHDLGEEAARIDGVLRTGYDIAKWMVNEVIHRNKDYITKDFKFNVHSANPVGAENIRGLLDGFIKSLNTQTT